MTDNRLRFWFRAGLLNLAIAALYGLVMRYKIAFDFPFFEQRNLLHAHSHFAFGGWVTHMLYCGFAALVRPYVPAKTMRKYEILIGLNLLCSFGMLLAFTAQGYKAVSITFSTLGVVLAVLFAVRFIKDRVNLPGGYAARPWAVTALVLHVLSSAGPFMLAYMMSTKNINSDWYLGSVYYYLHFQYNGWFFFGAVALLAGQAGFRGLGRYFRIVAFTVFPTLFLSLLWVKIPAWLYWITVAAAVIQLLAWITLLLDNRSSLKQLREEVSPVRWTAWLFYAAVAALSIKFVLQTISVVPALSQLVFGFRPIVIAYLHLVLLGVYSLFLVGYLLVRGYASDSRGARVAAFGFLGGVFLNELLLAIQGAAAFSYLPVPYINEMLVLAALALFLSASGFWLTQLRKSAT